MNTGVTVNEWGTEQRMEAKLTGVPGDQGLEKRKMTKNEGR